MRNDAFGSICSWFTGCPPLRKRMTSGSSSRSMKSTLSLGQQGLSVRRIVCKTTIVEHAPITSTKVDSCYKVADALTNVADPRRRGAAAARRSARRGVRLALRRTLWLSLRRPYRSRSFGSIASRSASPNKHPWADRIWSGWPSSEENQAARCLALNRRLWRSPVLASAREARRSRRLGGGQSTQAPEGHSFASSERSSEMAATSPYSWPSIKQSSGTGAARLGG